MVDKERRKALRCGVGGWSALVGCVAVRGVRLHSCPDRIGLLGGRPATVVAVQHTSSVWVV